MFPGKLGAGSAGQGDGGALILSVPVLNPIFGAHALLGCLLYCSSSIRQNYKKSLVKTFL